ncbi:MAG: bifunctional riboflavin kinase/FAD synthetase [Bdellovibrionaceae bacterium]|nr:bifunctional riboflavin kinase/FAD synthetase [Bdellovibrionales bacterium]MCB9085884.1 bifunctional riboflavin kinase/FAD synthetase [Pseudobdellovibrionaceae bacterium]
MKLVKGLSSSLIPPARGSALTIGSFDGLHLGHRALVGEILREAECQGLVSVVLTFDPHPIQFLQPDQRLRRLFPIEDLFHQAEIMGLDWLVVEAFNQDLATMDPEEFWLAKVQPKLNPKVLVVGHDFNFGAGRKGNLDFLDRLAKQQGFELRVLPPIRQGGEIVSSSRIRNLVQQGRMAQIPPLLCRPFAVKGQVSKGQQKGRGLGFPTANIENLETLVPASGVYITEVLIPSGQSVPAVTNVGVAPTLRPEDSGLRVETHLLAEGDWSLYNKEITVIFHLRLREEKKFATVEELKKQIQSDVKEALEFWRNQKKKDYGPKSP